MARLHVHYERAFEHYLRARRIPYVAVHEARKALTPATHPQQDAGGGSLKSFDFVIYAEPRNLLIDIKGRKVGRRAPGLVGGAAPRARLDSWATREDIDSLMEWERLFGAGFAAALLFVYWCDEQPPDGLFQEVLEFEGRWYALRTVLAGEYRGVMKVRSPKWGTVDLPTAEFMRVSRPFCPAWLASREAPAAAAGSGG